MVTSQVCVVRLGIGGSGGANVFASGFVPASLKSFDCFTTVVTLLGPATVAFVEMGTWNVTVPVLDRKRQTTKQHDVAARRDRRAGRNRANERRCAEGQPESCVGKVTFADPSEAVLAVFETTNLTAP